MTITSCGLHSTSSVPSLSPLTPNPELNALKYDLGVLSNQFSLDQSVLQWLVSELNHKSNEARRVGALRLLAAFEVPEGASTSLLGALLKILKSVREILHKKVSAQHGRPTRLPLLLCSLPCRPRSL